MDMRRTWNNDNPEKIVIFALIALLCFVNLNAYAEYLSPSASWFIIKDISEDAVNDLELVEFHKNYATDKYIKSDYPLDGYFQEYTLFNNGNVSHIVRLGVMYQYADEIPNDLFKTNDVPVRHQMNRLEMRNQYGDIGSNLQYAFIDIVFPPKKRTKIRVNDFSDVFAYNSTTYQWTDFVFRGIPRFTAIIGNYFLDRKHHDLGIEEYWINDIYIRINDSTHNSLTAIIAEEGSLSNRFFKIRKTNENTWEIEFTAEFVGRHRNNLSLSIEWGLWGHNLNMNDDGLRFNSEEKLSPYRYVFLTDKQLQVVRNAYYARHGYVFRNPSLRRMYEDFNFPMFGNINYKPNPNFHEGMLTDIDRANIATIQRLEALAEN